MIRGIHGCVCMPVRLSVCCLKQVLDIPRTLEFLETQGVCVAAYQTDEFPAFFTRHSGCRAPCRVDNPQQ
jgi:pseudouridine-5'-phosphate glycosidase